MFGGSGGTLTLNMRERLGEKFASTKLLPNFSSVGDLGAILNHDGEDQHVLSKKKFRNVPKRLHPHVCVGVCEDVWACLVLQQLQCVNGCGRWV